MSENCQRCRKLTEDLRTLWHACFYEMTELKIPFKINRIESENRTFYTLRVCKDCRSDWMSAIENWFTQMHWKHDTLPYKEPARVKINDKKIR